MTSFPALTGVPRVAGMLKDLFFTSVEVWCNSHECIWGFAAQVPIRTAPVPSWIHDFPVAQNYAIIPETPVLMNMQVRQPSMASLAPDGFQHAYVSQHVVQRSLLVYNP